MKRIYTILYVDDDHDDFILIADAFEKYTEHLIVVHAYNGIEGLSVLKKMNETTALPCLVILDINMPKMAGKEMLKRLHSNNDFKYLPVILFSTSNSAKDKTFAKEHHADFFTKPVNFSNLQSLVAEFVSRCKLEFVK